MPAKASGEIKTIIIHQKQKNGDVYVLERQTRYDPEKKFNCVLSSKIIGKIKKGTDTIVPTRPKRKKGEKASESLPESSPPSAAWIKAGMMDIIDYIGKSSGIDSAIYKNTDEGTAKKILSLARYFLAANGQSFMGITAWQYTYPLPFEDGFSEDSCHLLFESIGRDESLMQNFFASRPGYGQDTLLSAYDSRTVTTCSDQISEGRYGFNKADDGLETVKVLSLYSVKTKQPVAFAIQPGNQPDVLTIENTLKQLQASGTGRTEIVTDIGFDSENNLAELLQAPFDFITLIKMNLTWVKTELESHMEELFTTGSVCPFDPGTHGLTVERMQEFSLSRKDAGRRKGLSESGEESFRRKIYLHLYFHPLCRAEKDGAFDKDLLELKSFIEKGTPEDELSESAAAKIKKYLRVNRRGVKITVTFNEKAIADRKKYHGFFALVSNCEKDAFECLRNYRRRETIEFFFESGKEKTNGPCTRVWSGECLLGRMFIQFTALCYYEWYSEQLRQLKRALELEVNDQKSRCPKAEQEMKKKLLSWLNNTPVYLTLQWFDAVGDVRGSSRLLSERWTDERTKRDQLFLNRLNIPG